MAALTIELPEVLAQQVQARGISRQRLEKTVIHLVEVYLHECDKVSSSDRASPIETEPTWTDGEDFARRMIAGNRALFEELAQL